MGNDFINVVGWTCYYILGYVKDLHMPYDKDRKPEDIRIVYVHWYHWEEISDELAKKMLDGKTICNKQGMIVSQHHGDMLIAIYQGDCQHFIVFGHITDNVDECSKSECYHS
jgi:hypothetical protein